MKVRRHNSLNSLLATLLVVVAAAGCVEPIDITPPEVTDDVELTFQIALPDAGILTKADTDIAAVGDESKIYDLQVWAFTHEGTPDETAVGYGHVTSDGTIPTITMKLPSRIVNGTNPKLDFYALANGPSVGFTAVSYPQRSALQTATFGAGAGAGFGTECVSAVPATGLPMACYSAADFDVTFLRYGLTSNQVLYIKNHSKPDENPAEANFSQAQWNYFKDKWDYNQLCPTLKLKRSIAKIRFVFAKATGMTDEVQIASIALVNGNDENMLPTAMNVFPREDNTFPTYSNYEAFSWTGSPLVANAGIQTVDTPLRLRKDCTTVKYNGSYAVSESGTTPNEMSSQQYEKLLDNSIQSSSQKTLYLRESGSDKTAIKCKIGYQFKKTGDADFGTTKFAYIDIPVGATLARNTWWTVYAYFISYELGFNVTVADWDGIGSSPNNNSHLQ